MKKLGSLILGIGLLVVSLGFADDSKFEAHKAKALKRVEEHIAKLQEQKGCISSAKDHEAMKACHEKMKQWWEEKSKEHHEGK
jgi:hypothetical protein